MKKWFFDLQLFADGAEESAEDTTQDAAQNEGKDGQQKGQQSEVKYTDEDINRIIGQKFAKWQKEQEKKTSEAERLAKMTAEEKAAARFKALEDKLSEYERKEARANMMKQARTMLQDKNIAVSDELVANLIAEDAEGTKEAVESFTTLFQAAVDMAVKNALKGNQPKGGGQASGITKEQIMQIANRAERQQKIAENIDLFK